MGSENGSWIAEYDRKIWVKKSKVLFFWVRKTLKTPSSYLLGQIEYIVFQRCRIVAAQCFIGKRWPPAAGTVAIWLQPQLSCTGRMHLHLVLSSPHFLQDDSHNDGRLFGTGRLQELMITGWPKALAVSSSSSSRFRRLTSVSHKQRVKRRGLQFAVSCKWIRVLTLTVVNVVCES